MDAIIENDREITIIHLKGRLAYERMGNFKQTCKKEFAGKNIVFDLTHLSFVGSYGITSFVDTVRELAEGSEFGLKMFGVGIEFIRMFAAEPINKLEIYVNRDDALKRIREGVHLDKNILPQYLLSNQTEIEG